MTQRSDQRSARSEAKEAGLKFYQGAACKRGHTLRYVSNGACVQCALEGAHRQTKGSALRGIQVAREGNALTITVPLGMSVTIHHQ